MKILVVCYSLTGKTRVIAKRLAKSLQADYADLLPLRWKSKFSAYTVGLFLAQAHKAVEVLPLEEDVASYDCVVVAGPIWGGCPAPMLNGFVRQYHLAGKKTFGLLTCGMEGKNAPKTFRHELEEAGTRCRSVITIKSEAEAIDALEKGKIEFVLNEKGKIILQVNEHNRKKKLTPNQVQAMQELIDAAQEVDSQKKPADKSPEPTEQQGESEAFSEKNLDENSVCQEDAEEAAKAEPSVEKTPDPATEPEQNSKPAKETEEHPKN